MTHAADSNPAPPRESRLGDVRIWGLVFAGVFVALVVSVAVQLSRGYYDARYVDLGASRLVETATGTHLRLVLRHAPRHGQLSHEVRPPAGGNELYTVAVSLSAEGSPAPYEDEDDRRVIEVDLPRIERVRVLDLRWAREEVAVIELSRAGKPGAGS